MRNFAIMSHNDHGPQLPPKPPKGATKRSSPASGNPEVHGIQAAKTEILASPSSAARTQQPHGAGHVQTGTGRPTSSSTSVETRVHPPRAAQLSASASLSAAAKELRLWPPTNRAALPEPTAPTAFATSVALDVRNLPLRARRPHNSTLQKASAGDHGAAAQPGPHPLGNHSIPPPSLGSLMDQASFGALPGPHSTSLRRAGPTSDSDTVRQEIAKSQRESFQSTPKFVPISGLAPFSEPFAPGREPHSAAPYAFQGQVNESDTACVPYPANTVALPRQSAPPGPGLSSERKKPDGTHSSLIERHALHSSGGPACESDREPCRRALAVPTVLAEQRIRNAKKSEAKASPTVGKTYEVSAATQNTQDRGYLVLHCAVKNSTLCTFADKNYYYQDLPPHLAPHPAPPAALHSAAHPAVHPPYRGRRGYDDATRSRVFDLVNQGLSLGEIERRTGISKVTVSRWKKTLQTHT